MMSLGIFEKNVTCDIYKHNYTSSWLKDTKTNLKNPQRKVTFFSETPLRPLPSPHSPRAYWSNFFSRNYFFEVLTISWFRPIFEWLLVVSNYIKPDESIKIISLWYCINSSLMFIKKYIFLVEWERRKLLVSPRTSPPTTTTSSGSSRRSTPTPS